MITSKSRHRSKAPTVRTVDRALDVLFYLADVGTPAALVEIANGTGLDKATVYRLLHAMRVRDLVHPAEEPGRYVLGLGVLRLSSAVLGGVDIRSVARPFMRQLCEMCAETLVLSILTGDRRVFIDQVESPNEVRWVAHIGQSAPLSAGSTSKAILAFLPEEERQAILGRTPFVAETPRSPKSAEELGQQLAEVRRDGVAYALGERVAGIAGMSAPIFDHSGRPIGALTIGGPSHRFDLANEERLQKALLAATRDISAQLGYRVQPAPDYFVTADSRS